MTKRAHLALALAAVASLAACGGSSNNTTASTPAPTPTPAPVLKTATATVGTASETILTNASGMTVYYFTVDKGAGKVSCTATCAGIWPPVLLGSDVTKPVGDKGVTGTLGTIANPAGGTQLTYNGWPVYTYSKDTKAGDTTGQNVAGKWFVVTPDVAPNS